MSRFERLYRENFQFVWAAARRCGAPAGAVDDVVQDVFVTAYRRLDDLHFEVSPRGWLYGVTRRVASRYRRSVARVVRRRAAIASHTACTPDMYRRREAAQQLEAWLEQMDQRRREVWVMIELLGMSAPEIAGELRIPVNTVYSRLRLARAQLQGLAASAGEIATGVAAAQDEQRPASGQADQTLAAIAPALAGSWPVLTAKALGLAKWASLPAVAGACVVAVVVAVREPPPTLGTGPAVRAQTHEQVTPRPRHDAAAGEPAAARSTSDSPSLGVVGITASQQAPRSNARAKPSPAPAPAPADATPVADLAAELTLIERARARSKVDPHAALQLFATHAQRFPDGQLDDAREAGRFEALCALGRFAEAEATAKALHRDHEGSNVARAVPPACSDGGP